MMRRFLILRVSERTGFMNPFPYRIRRFERVVESGSAYHALKKFMHSEPERQWCTPEQGYTIGRVGTGHYSIFDEFDRTMYIAVEDGYYYYDKDMNKVVLTEEGFKNGNIS